MAWWDFVKNPVRYTLEKKIEEGLPKIGVGDRPEPIPKGKPEDISLPEPTGPQRPSAQRNKQL